MSEAAEQLDESNALKKECASLPSAIDRLESDKAGSLQRILGLVESQVAHVHGRVVFRVEHLYKLTYPGDKKMGDFKQRWLEIIAGIKPESVPQEEELRDTLCRQVKGNSKKLEVDLKLYGHMERNDPAKTHKYLLNVIDRRVKATGEEQNLENKEKSLKDHKLGNALPSPKEKAKPKPKAKSEAKSEAKDAQNLAPVLPDKKKPKEKAKPRGRSPSKTRDPSPWW